MLNRCVKNTHLSGNSFIKHYVMMVHIEDHIPATPTTKVKLKTKEDEKIFKRLSE